MPWSTEDLEILAKEYPKSVTRELAKKLLRSTHCVYLRARKIGINKDRDYMREQKSITGKRVANSGKYKPVHGLSHCDNGTYKTWVSMRSRCYKKSHKSYADYGGRGITICERWNDFSNFYADMGERPEKLTLGRIDNSLGYSPENCKWETAVEQGNNKRSNLWLTAHGKTMTLTQWARHSKISGDTIMVRLTKLGWPLDVALTKPVKKAKNNSLRLGKAYTT